MEVVRAAWVGRNDRRRFGRARRVCHHCWLSAKPVFYERRERDELEEHEEHEEH
jgi:hypothetical protein